MVVESHIELALTSIGISRMDHGPWTMVHTAQPADGPPGPQKRRRCSPGWSVWAASGATLAFPIMRNPFDPYV